MNKEVWNYTEVACDRADVIKFKREIRRDCCFINNSTRSRYNKNVRWYRLVENRTRRDCNKNSRYCNCYYIDNSIGASCCANKNIRDAETQTGIKQDHVGYNSAMALKSASRISLSLSRVTVLDIAFFTSDNLTCFPCALSKRVILCRDSDRRRESRRSLETVAFRRGRAQ